MSNIEKNIEAWNICISEPFLNCEKFYPIQKSKVKEMLDYLKSNRNIKKIIIFGSSVTPLCHMGSDVDIYIELENEQETKLINKFFNFVFDLFTNFDVDERLLKEIKTKGVVVYEK